MGFLVVVLDSFYQGDLAPMPYFKDVLKSCTARVIGLCLIFKSYFAAFAQVTNFL